MLLMLNKMHCMVSQSSACQNLIGEKKEVRGDQSQSSVQRVGLAVQEVEAAWQPPQEQRGDGRTALNDKFRY